MSVTGSKLGFKTEDLLSNGAADWGNILAVRNWLDGNKIPPLSDEHIILFLTACDHDVEFAKKTIEENYQIKLSRPELFSNRKVNNDDIQNALRSGRICTWRDDENFVFVYYTFNPDHQNWSFFETTKLAFMTLESITYDYPPKGLYILVDCNELKLGILPKLLHPHLIRTCFSYLQRAVPVKLTRIYFLNSMYIACKAVQMMKPFMDKKLFDQLVHCPRDLNWEEFYENSIPRRSLPENLGGKLPTIDVLGESLIKKMENLEPYYEAEEMWFKQS